MKQAMEDNICKKESGMIERGGGLDANEYDNTIVEMHIWCYFVVVRCTFNIFYIFLGKSEI